MIEYVLEHNPDDRIIKKACQILKSGGLICLPTDTNWVLIADPFNKEGMEKLYKIKKETPQKHFSLLCSSISQASDMAIIDNQCFRILKKIIPGHYTFIFEATKKVAKAIKASKTDKEIGIRFVPSHLVQTLIKTLGQSVISTNIPKDLFDQDEVDMIYSYMIEDSELAYQIDMIIDPGEFDFVGASTIITFLTDPPEVLRVGAGEINQL